MAKWYKKKWVKITSWVLGTLAALIVLIPFLLYIPWVQNVVKDWVCSYVSSETGMEVTVERVHIKFPLDVSMDGLLVLDEHRDTMVMAENFTAGIEVLPLFKLDVQVGDARLTEGRYHLVSEDSSMLVDAKIHECMLRGTDIDLKHNRLNVLDGELNGGEVNLVYMPWKVKEDPDTTQSEPWKIHATRLRVNDINYTMTMLPTIDGMTTHIKSAMLTEAYIDTGEHTVDAQSLHIDGAECSVYTLDDATAAAFNASHPLPPDPPIIHPSDTIPWTIRADTLRLTSSDALYAVRGTKPVEGGLDMNHIGLHDLNVQITNFYNRDTNLSARLDSLRLHERSGLQIQEGRGEFDLSATHVDVRDVKLRTFLSDITLDANADMSLLDSVPRGSYAIRTDSKIALQEVAMLSPELRTMLKGVPFTNPLTLKADISGTPSTVDIKSCHAHVPRYLTADVRGKVKNFDRLADMSGNVTFDAQFENIDFLKPTLFDAATQSKVNLPPMHVKGNADFHGSSYSGDVQMALRGGSMVGKGSFNGTGETYDVDLDLKSFPVKAILPLAPVDNITARIKARGQGFDFLNGKTTLDADVDLGNIVYDNVAYRDIKATAKMQGNNFSAMVNSRNPNCDLFLQANGTKDGDRYSVDLDGNINDLDLGALKLYDGTLRASGVVTGRADVDLKAKTYRGALRLTDMSLDIDGSQLYAEEATAEFDADNDFTSLYFNNEDTHFSFESEMGLDDFLAAMQHSLDVANGQIKARNLDINTLQESLPSFTMNVKMGPDGLIPRYLAQYDIEFRDVLVDIANDSTIHIDAVARSLSYGSTAIDTLTFQAHEMNKYLAFKAHMGNRRGTWDDMARVDIEGGAIGSTVDFLLTQHNISGKQGYRIGANATLDGNSIKTRLFPDNPVIGYRTWALNKDNYLNFNYHTNMLDADLNLVSGDSQVALRTNQRSANDEDIFVNIKNMELAEWVPQLLDLPPIEGNLSADLKFRFDGKNVEGGGEAKIKGLVYDGYREGDVGVTAQFHVDPETQSTRLDADVDFNGSRVALAYGSLNDITADNPFNITVKLDRFPLNKINPFMPVTFLRAGGYANGEVTMRGNANAFVLDGTIVSDSARLSSPTYGMKLNIGDQPIVIKNSVITVKNLELRGSQGNAGLLNGTVNVQNLDNMTFDLTARGKNVMLIDSKQRSWSELFGKGFADIDMTIKGNADRMTVNADVDVLPTSNLTYVLKEDISTLQSDVDENMVTFINNDEGAVNLGKTEAATSALDMKINLNFVPGSKLGVFLFSDDGKDNVTMNPSGLLKYTLDFAGRDKLVGTLNIDGGNLHYSPPMISEIAFDIDNGSRIIWTGDMFNPQLDLSGEHKLKASATSEEGGSHFVDFIINAFVGGTFNNIDLNFNMSANDMAVENELQSMSPNQRSAAAINLMLYGTYSGMNTSDVNFSASGALYSFLQSQINNWAARTLNGVVDLSFGINQYANATSGTETSYSYRLSKSLFNDRFKVVVGGEYSTDASREQNFSSNLINDVSAEYMLNAAGSKYIRIFSHKSFKNILEGEITETGVGFVMKRKLRSLRDLFKFHHSHKAPADSLQLQPSIVIEAVEPDPTPAPQPETNPEPEPEPTELPQ